MRFNERKFEHMAHGELKETPVEPYKTPMGEDIQIKETVKDLGVQVTSDLKFRDHMKKVIS